MADEETGEIEGAETIPDVLDLHSTEPTQVAIKGVKHVIFEPTHTITSTGKIHFRLKTDSCQYLDPRNTFIMITSRLLSNKGEPLEWGDPKADGDDKCKALYVNGLSSAWFKNVEVKVNGQVIDHGDSMYAYRADLENRLSYPQAAKEGCLQLMGWYNEHVAFEDIHADALGYKAEPQPDSEHSALMARFHKTLNGREFKTIGPIHSDIFDQPKVLPEHMVMELAFDRNEPEFVTLTKQATPVPFRAVITSCQILALVANVDEEIAREMKSVTFAGRSLLYPVRRVKMFSFALPTGHVNINEPDITPGEEYTPKRIFITFVRQTAKSGAYDQDPFNYQHFHLTSLNLKVGGEDRPLPALKMNYTRGDYTMPLYSLLHATGTLFNDEELGINSENYHSRNVIYGFDVAGTQSCTGPGFQIGEQNTVAVTGQLDGPLTYPITMIVYAEYDGEIEITPDTKVVKHDNA